MEERMNLGPFRVEIREEGADEDLATYLCPLGHPLFQVGDTFQFSGHNGTFKVARRQWLHPARLRLYVELRAVITST